MKKSPVIILITHVYTKCCLLCYVMLINDISAGDGTQGLEHSKHMLYDGAPCPAKMFH